MNRPEMMKALKEKGIAFTPSMKNVELEDLLKQDEASKLQAQLDAGKEMVVIYDGEDKCERCKGWKRIDDGVEGISWKHWAELPEQSAIAVRMGLVKPITCPDCNGSGRQPTVVSVESEAPEGQIDPSEPEEASLPPLRHDTGEFETPLKQDSVAPDTIAVDGKMFSKLVYDMTQGYTSYWTGVSGRLRLMEMCGATNKAEVEAMYKQLKEKYLGSRR
jgi:hypothetical protein